MATIKLTVMSKDLEFKPTLHAYNSYINEMQPNNKISPSHNFLMRIVAQKSKANLEELLKLPGASIQIAGKVVEEYAPNIEITVGK
ncbi:MAG TPA: hypothetical protein DCS48_03135 [Desulfovibrio sp.]|nr:hypothetical protein [Desulfovibrio sp.]